MAARSRSLHPIHGQLDLDMCRVEDYFQMLHNGQHGIVLSWERHKPKNCWLKLKPGDPRIPEILQSFQGKEDIFLTPNEFRGWRLVRQLDSLRACYVDVDGCADLELVLDTLAENRQPWPNAVLFSGRGLHLYWLLEPLPPQTLPVWQRIQDELIRVLAPIGADPSAKDCTRVLRVSGSLNSKNGEEVRGRILDGHRWSLRQLAFEVLGRDGKGKKPAEVRDIRTKRTTPDKAIQGSIYARWHLVFLDLMAISAHHGHNIPAGYRDKWLFLVGVALSWFTHPQGIEAEILSLGRENTQLDPSEIVVANKTTIQRALDAAAGEKIQWRGQEVDPRYRFRRQTLYEWLAPIIPAGLLPKLRAIIPNEIARGREYSRKKARYSDHYTKQGVRASNQEKRAQAQSMRDAGASYREIATELGIATRTAEKWCKGVY